MYIIKFNNNGYKDWFRESDIASAVSKLNMLGNLGIKTTLYMDNRSKRKRNGKK